MDELFDELPNVKITFSKFCCSGFYGDECRCKRCCEQQNKPYSELDEHRDWIYAQVMQGESFIVHNVKPVVTFNKDKKPEFGKTFTYFYGGEISTETEGDRLCRELRNKNC